MDGQRESSSTDTACQRQLNYAIERLYEIIQAYETPLKVSSCLHCYTADELKSFRAVPLHELPPHLAGQLLRETGDHWENTTAYKHYLPRILEVLAPPLRELELYPEHLFETFRFLGFNSWPLPEKRAVMDYVRAFLAVLSETAPEESKEWLAAAERARLE